MGARLVSAAINSHWSRLTHLQHRVLVIMAQTSLDSAGNGHPRAVYWGGRSYLSLCIYGTDQPTKSQINAIAQAIAGLIEAGAIERVRAATGQRRTRYRLILDQFGQPPLPEE